MKNKKNQKGKYNCVECNKKMQFKGFCSQQCHDKYYDELNQKEELTLTEIVLKVVFPIGGIIGWFLINLWRMLL